MEGKGLTQRDLDFMEAEKARDVRAKARALEAKIDRNLRPTITRLGEKHFAYLMGLGPEKQDRIYHWTERRNGQRPPAELLAAVHAEDEAALNEYLELLGYETTRRKLVAEGSALARALAEELRGFGEQGLEAIERAKQQASRRDAPEWERTTPVRAVKP